MVMHVELQATCSALGYQEGSKYIKEPDCLETVKDLIRFLKREEDCDIRRQLGEAQIVQNDLLPLLKNYHKDTVLFDTLIRLLVNLTQPAILCFQNQIPTEKSLRNYYLEVESHLQDYKEAFVDDELFSVLTGKLGDLLKLDWEHRQEEDKLLIERILILIRNVLHVPPTQSEQRTDDDASTHDQVIWTMHSSGLEDLLLYIASSDEERQFSLHVLEIISLMFREQTPEMLASAGVQRSYSEKEKDERELEMIREQEKVQKQANVMKFSSRHSRFGGTFVVKNMKSISDRDMIAHKMHKSLNEITFDVNKKPKKKAKNLQPIKDQEVFRRSTLSVRLGLKEFCIQFLENCYNPLMYAVKDILARERSQDNDETYYMWSLRFFMEFCRLHSKQVELVSETMSVQTFHYIQVQLFSYYEMIMTEKKEAIIWGKRVHLALKAYQELLLTLDSMDKSKNNQLIESSKVIKSNVFYTMEFRDIYFTLLKKFNQSKQSRTYLKDLVETTHLFLKMLEQFSKEQSHMVVQTKKTKKTKKKKRQPAPVEAPEHSQQELDDMWDEISGELSALFQGRGDEIPTDVTPFDAASEVDVEQQRVDAMIRIQDAMREKRPAESVALLRAAREVWPERNEFGAPDITPEEEFMSLREIFMANLPRAPTELPTMPEEEGYEDYNEVEEEEMESVMTAEKEFEFKSFINRFVKPEIMKAYVILLSDFQKNSVHTNHCIIKMLHRVAVDLGYTGMVFQASLFRIFQKIMLSPLAKVERYKEIVKFGTYVVRKFVEVAQDNKKIFMELLFWKGNKESVEVIEGYGSYQSKGKVAWTEDQESELRQLYEEVQHNNDPEKDVAETIMERLTDNNRTRPQIIRELKRQGLISSAKELKRNLDSGWPEELQMELRNLFEQFKEQEGLDKDIAECIKDNLSDPSKSRNHIIRELKRLELITSAKELKRKTNRRRKRRGSGSDSDDGGGRVTATGPWTDDEESELTDLFTKYNSSDDPLGDIMSKLTIKRSKKKIIEKLLQLGLIDDRKEVYKKKQRKNKKETDEMDDFIEDSDSDSDNDDNDNNRLDELPSDSEDDGSSVASSGSDSDKDSESEADLDLDAPATGSGAVDMKSVIKDIVDKGYTDQIKWIQRAMRRAAEDTTRIDNDVSVPIVPLTEENETAMEDEHFLSFLRKIGICPPANEQEMFWRIPPDLKSADLLNTVEGLELDEDGEPINAHKIQVRQMCKKTEKDKKKKKSGKKTSSRFNALKEMAKKRKTQQKEDKKLRRDRNRRKSGSPKTKPLQEENAAHDNDESSNDVPVSMETTSQTSANNLESSASKKKSRIRRVMDSDSEDSAKENIPDQDDDHKDSSSQSQKRPLVFADSSDEEDSQPSKRLRPSNSSDSEDDVPLSAQVKTGQAKQTKIFDSDESDVPLSAKMKKDKKKKPKSKKKKEKSNDKPKENTKQADSDSSDDDIPLSRKSIKPKPTDPESIDEDMPLSKTDKSKAKKSDSSDDDDDDTPLAAAVTDQTESFPATLYTQAPYSDSGSDVDDHVPLRRVLQKKNVIESDEDE